MVCTHAKFDIPVPSSLLVPPSNRKVNRFIDLSRPYFCHFTLYKKYINKSRNFSEIY